MAFFSNDCGYFTSAADVTLFLFESLASERVSIQTPGNEEFMLAWIKLIVYTTLD